MSMSASIRDRESAKFVQSPARPNGSSVEQVSGAYATRIHQVNSNLIYYGWAEIGTSDASPKWRIMRQQTVASIVRGEYADGNGDFDNVWTNHESLTYI
jgi:hypothetical protein